MEKLFPGIIMALSFLSSVIYLSKGELRVGCYWFSAGLIALSLTFLPERW